MPSNSRRKSARGRAKPDKRVGSEWFGRWNLFRNLAIVILLLILGLFLESRERRGPAAQKCNLIESGSATQSEQGAAQMAVASYRTVRSRRVTVVALREEADPSRVLGNVCEQRFYLASLIQASEERGASEIVLDKFFSPNSCEGSDQGTSQLIQAVDRSKVPIIIGRATHAPKTEDPSGACLILSDSLDFGNKIDTSGKFTDIPAVSMGLTRLNADVRKIPLSWSCYSSDADFAVKDSPLQKRVPSIAWIAASNSDSGLKHENIISSLEGSGHHPFTSFVPPDAMIQIEALSIICNSSQRQAIEARYKVDCSHRTSGRPQLGGQIVVIGEDVEGSDRHRLFDSDVSGVYLQANYIESLLDDRFMKPLDPAWNFLGLAAWLILLYVLFWMIPPEIALGSSVLVILLLRFLLIELVHYKGFYPQSTILDLGIVAPLLKYVDSRGHNALHAIRARFETSRNRKMNRHS